MEEKVKNDIDYEVEDSKPAEDNGGNNSSNSVAEKESNLAVWTIVAIVVIAVAVIAAVVLI